MWLARPEIVSRAIKLKFVSMTMINLTRTQNYPSFRFRSKAKNDLIAHVRKRERCQKVFDCTSGPIKSAPTHTRDELKHTFPFFRFTSNLSPLFEVS
jgi:hypothetical protein